MEEVRATATTPRPRRQRGWTRVGIGSALSVAALSGVGILVPAAPSSAAGSGFNEPGNILVADQFNNRVIEFDGRNPVWHFGDGSSTAGPNSIVGPNDVERVGNLTLIAGTGTPMGADPSCTNSSGCVDNRVIYVNQAGQIVWKYGSAGVTGDDFNQLNVPVQATALPNGDVLITDQGNNRIIEVTMTHHIVWQYGRPDLPGGAGFDQLNNPNSAQLLPNGHILIADENNNRVIEVDRNHNIVWQYGSPTGNALSGAAFASRLPNGNTLITDSNNSRIVTVTADKSVVFVYETNDRPGSMEMPLPTRAVQLANGNILISDQFNDQVIEINSEKEIVFSLGMIQVDGNGFNQLNAPYDAKVIGDYTGLTRPF
jgi:hypothetical protein